MMRFWSTIAHQHQASITWISLPVVELKRLTQSKPMLTAGVTGERCSYRLFRRFAACIAVGGQHSRIMLTGHNRSHDLHPRRPGNVRAHVMQLQMHLHQRFLHVLDVSGGILPEALAM